LPEVTASIAAIHAVKHIVSENRSRFSENNDAVAQNLKHSCAPDWMRGALWFFQASVGRRLGFEFLNLVLECQLAALQLCDFEVVDRWMEQCLVDLALDITVFPLQLFKMVGKRHEWFLPFMGSSIPAQACRRLLANVTVE
jgi:hypothetical protein